MVLRPRLPGHHLSKESLDVVKVAVGMIAAMSSLVLGLMTASVKGSFDLIDRQHRLYAARQIQLDDALRHYGPEAVDGRVKLKQYVERVIAQDYSAAGDYRSSIEDRQAGDLLDAVKDDIAALVDHDRASGSGSAAVGDDSGLWRTVAEDRWRRACRNQEDAIPAPRRKGVRRG